MVGWVAAAAADSRRVVEEEWVTVTRAGVEEAAPEAAFRWLQMPAFRPLVEPPVETVGQVPW